MLALACRCLDRIKFVAAFSAARRASRECSVGDRYPRSRPSISDVSVFEVSKHPAARVEEHPTAKVPSTLQRDLSAPCSEVSKHPAAGVEEHPTAKVPSTLQRDLSAPCSEVSKHPTAKAPSTLPTKHGRALFTPNRLS